MEQEKKRCFVIMPISDTEGYDKGHFNRVYEHLIKPACKQAGFEPIRADDTSKANMIIVDILKNILECDMAICDLSSRNPNVFYELGFRQAFNLKTVLIKDIKTSMPFDISGIRTLPYNENLRIDEVEKTVPEIAKCITETFKTDDKDINSLLQLLSVEKPATLPEKFILSQDSSIILNAIEELNNKFELISNNTKYTSICLPNNTKYTSICLPNGETVDIGDFLYINRNKEYVELGELISITPHNISIKGRNGEITPIPRNGQDFQNLTKIPF